MRAPCYEAQFPALTLQRENPSSPDQFWIPKPPPTGGGNHTGRAVDQERFCAPLTRGAPSFRSGSAPPCITMMSAPRGPPVFRPGY
jgi:hypothetical protein